MKIAIQPRCIVLALGLIAGFIASESGAVAQEKYTPTPANLEARTWFQDAKFGMFIHWGVYSVLGDGEWIMENRPINRTDYAMLAAECHKQGIKLFFYHSQLDWHSQDYFPRGRTGHRTGRPEAGNWDAYLNFMDGQLKELLTNYGEIGGIWFDGMWDKPDADWHLARTYGLINQR